MKITSFCNSLTHKTWCYITNTFWTTKLIIEEIVNKNSFELEKNHIYKLLNQNEFEEAELRLANLSEFVGKYNHALFKLNSEINYKKLLHNKKV